MAQDHCRTGAVPALSQKLPLHTVSHRFYFATFRASHADYLKSSCPHNPAHPLHQAFIGPIKTEVIQHLQGENHGYTQAKFIHSGNSLDESHMGYHSASGKKLLKSYAISVLSAVGGL